METQVQNINQASEVQVKSFKVFFNLISKDQINLETIIVDAEQTLTFQECAIILQQKIKKPMNHIQYRLDFNSEPLNPQTKISDVVKNNDTDVYLSYEQIKPILKEKEKQIQYDTISKYSYLDQKKYVKIYVPLDQIGKLPEANIHSRFLDRSFQIKIHDYNGKNWIFAVPKTQCQILIKQSKVVKKDNKLIIYLGKIAEGDNWFSLHKTRCVGQKELD